MLSFWPASKRPTMPKSISARRPSSVSRMLPGCGSQWNTPSMAICFMYADSRSVAMALRVACAASSARGTSARWRPCTKLSVSTRCECHSRIHASACTARKSAIWRPMQACVFGLEPEVQLLVQAGLELAHHLHQPVARAERGVARGEARDFAQHLQVDLDALPHAGPLDFDRHFGAVAQHRAVDLGHRRRRQRLLVERLEQLVDRRLQLGLDDLHDAFGRHRLDGVLQSRQGVDVVRRQQVRPRAQQLAELDEARPELFERAGQLGAVVVVVVGMRRRARPLGASRSSSSRSSSWWWLMPSSATTWWSRYLRRTRKISKYRSGCLREAAGQQAAGGAAAGDMLLQVGHGAVSCRDAVGRGRRSRRASMVERAVAVRFALAEHDMASSWRSSGSPIGQRHEQVQQQRLAVPVADLFAEAEDLFEARAQQPVVVASHCMVVRPRRGPRPGVRRRSCPTRARSRCLRRSAD